jgi:hypothetical protein
MTQTIMPNTESSAANENTTVLGLDQIAAKMDAMKAMTQRNQLRATDETVTGESAEANVESPVAPEGSDAQPEVATPETEDYDSIEEVQAQSPEEETVSEESDSNSSEDELIDFIDFAETNPNAKFKFTRNGKEVIIDAKKAAAILGQGGAIHEEARQLKIQKAEFEEYAKEKATQQENLTLAMELTIQPKLKHAYEEILKTQNYNTTFQQQLARTQDPAEQARIQASMEQNNRYMHQQSQLIGQLKPNLDHFRQVRTQQIQAQVEKSRKSFTDKELKNEYVFNELREKLGKNWTNANGETVPGVKNLDLITSDEFLLGLVRDGMKFRDRPATKQAGNSIAALTQRKGTVPQNKSAEDNVNSLREKAKGGDKKAADNLLMQQLSKIRAARTSR